MPWYTQGDERTTWRFMSALLPSMSQESDLGITLGSKCVYHFARPILFAFNSASSLILIITFDNYLEHFSRHYTKSLQLPFKVDFKILH